MLLWGRLAKAVPIPFLFSYFPCPTLFQVFLTNSWLNCWCNWLVFLINGWNFFDYSNGSGSVSRNCQSFNSAFANWCYIPIIVEALFSIVSTEHLLVTTGGQLWRWAVQFSLNLSWWWRMKYHWIKNNGRESTHVS